MYNGVIRALRGLGLADVWGESQIPLHVLNVTYPLVDEDLAAFCAGKQAVLMVEEGAPDYLEQALNTILRRADIQTKIAGKDVLLMGGEYTANVLAQGVRKFIERYDGPLLPQPSPTRNAPDLAALAATVPPRPPSFCTGCPERPIFSAMTLVQQELGQRHIAGDIGCHLFALNEPFNIGSSTMGYGLGPSSISAMQVPGAPRAMAVMGDGGFWHNGLLNGIGNAVYNQHDGVVVLVDNFYSAATGGQDLLSSRATPVGRSTNHPIEDAIKGVGAQWVRRIDRTYDVGKMLATFREALTTTATGPKIIIASSECMLNRQRREKPLVAASIKRGERNVRPRFGVDEDVCTGDRACIRLSGCPSLSTKPSGDPLKPDPVVAIDNSCVGCGNCGEVSEAAVLCPSFYRADIVTNPSAWDRFMSGIRRTVITWLQRRRDANRLVIAV